MNTFVLALKSNFIQHHTTHIKKRFYVRYQNNRVKTVDVFVASIPNAHQIKWYLCYLAINTKYIHIVPQMPSWQSKSECGFTFAK